MRYFILLVLFFTSCNNKRHNNSKKASNNKIIILNVDDKINIDSLLSVVIRGECVCTGTTGLGGKSTEEFKAYEIMDKVMTNEQLHELLKNKSPKIRFAAINILHDRKEQDLFEEGAKILANDTSLVCSASGCLQIELPLNEHIKILNKQKN